eukprot:tig00001532_g9281.t1
MQGILSSVLTHTLGGLLETPPNLSLSLYSGKVTLSDVRLRPEALHERFDLPLAVVQGSIGRLELAIPWTKLRSQPLRLTLERCAVVVQPKRRGDEELTEAYVENVVQQHLDARLAALVAAKGPLLEENGDGNGRAPVATNTYADMLLRNLEVLVKDIHVRFEDRAEKGVGGGFLAAGLVLRGCVPPTDFPGASPRETLPAELRVQTADGAGGGGPGEAKEKLASLDGLAAYVDPRASPLPANWEEAMAEVAEGRGPGPPHVLAPVAGEARLRFAGEREAGAPLLAVDLRLGPAAARLDGEQYGAAVRSFGRLAAASRPPVDAALAAKRREAAELGAGRPSLRPGADAGGWWRFAGTCAWLRARERAASAGVRLRWEHLRRRRAQRIEYLPLAVKRATGEVVARRQAERLEELEARELPLFDLVLRAMASVLAARHREEKAARGTVRSVVGSLLARATAGRLGPHSVEDDLMGGREGAAAFRAELARYEGLFGRGGAPARDELRLTAALGGASLTLVQLGPAGAPARLLAASAEGLSLAASRRGEQAAVEARLGTLRVADAAEARRPFDLLLAPDAAFAPTARFPPPPPPPTPPRPSSTSAPPSPPPTALPTPPSGSGWAGRGPTPSAAAGAPAGTSPPRPPGPAPPRLRLRLGRLAERAEGAAERAATAAPARSVSLDVELHAPDILVPEDPSAPLPPRRPPPRRPAGPAGREASLAAAGRAEEEARGEREAAGRVREAVREAAGRARTGDRAGLYDRHELALDGLCLWRERGEGERAGRGARARGERVEAALEPVSLRVALEARAAPGAREADLPQLRVAAALPRVAARATSSTLRRLLRTAAAFQRDAAEEAAALQGEPPPPPGAPQEEEEEEGRGHAEAPAKEEGAGESLLEKVGSVRGRRAGAGEPGEGGAGREEGPLEAEARFELGELSIDLLLEEGYRPEARPGADEAARAFLARLFDGPAPAGAPGIAALRARGLRGRRSGGPCGRGRPSRSTTSAWRTASLVLTDAAHAGYAGVDRGAEVRVRHARAHVRRETLAALLELQRLVRRTL